MGRCSGETVAKPTSTVTTSAWSWFFLMYMDAKLDTILELVGGDDAEEEAD